MGEECAQANDIAMLEDMARYMNNEGAAADGRHANMPDLIWWDWNADSGDTGPPRSSPPAQSGACPTNHMPAPRNQWS
jgi:hypothetical protein